MRRMKIEERLAKAEERFPRKVAELKKAGKWSEEQEAKAVAMGKKTK